MPATKLYSIGYATKPLTVFLTQLKQHNITAIADVRSVPYSKRFYDYHQESIRDSLKQAGIHYVYLGEELGPRSKNNDHYDQNNQVQFNRLMQSTLFLQGIERLKTGLDKGLSIALMCAEKNPADCHRSLLIAYYVEHTLGWQVNHIKHNGDLESQSDMEARLLEEHCQSADLFLTKEQQTAEAYQRQTQLKAYRRP